VVKLPPLPPLMEPEGTFSYSQEPATLSYREPGKSSPHIHILFVSDPPSLCRVFQVSLYFSGDHGSAVVKVLCYKSQGRWFDPS